MQPIGSRTAVEKIVAGAAVQPVVAGQPEQLLDYDLGIGGFDRRRLAPFFHFGWTTMSHGEGCLSQRVLIPLRPATSVEGHEVLRAYFMGEHSQHHDGVSQPAILPVQRVDSFGREAPVRVWGNIGQILNPVLFLSRHRPVLFKPRPARVPGGGYAVAESTRANAAYLCGFLKIPLLRFRGLHPSEPVRIPVRCPLGDQHDKIPSAVVSVFPFGHKRDIWVKCHGHPD